MGKLREKMLKDLQVRRLALSTQKQYINAVRDIAKYYGQSPELINSQQVQDWLLYLSNPIKANLATRLLDNPIKIKIHKKPPCFIFGRFQGLIYLTAKKIKQIVDLCL